MRDLSTFGQRLAWARNQQRMILQQVADATGLAIGYISQLEKGAKANPTWDAVVRLAKALGVTAAFLYGEQEMTPVSEAEAALVGGRAGQIGQAFANHYRGLTPQRRGELALEPLERRFIYAVSWLCSEYEGEEYTPVVIAYQLGISTRALNDVLDRNCGLGVGELDRFSMLTGIPMGFFTEGCWPETEVRVAPERVLAYLPALAAAERLGVSPEQLLALIEGQR